ncbi:MAG TPA: efflux transporter outer membrane subunit [Methylococcaceae bacterium]|nr:efflux transporter outer membrane subunit [Methylococcaceae bacterium]
MRKIFVFALSAALVGCFKVGPDYQRPQIDTPKQWRFADQQARDLSNTQWWEQLGDPALNRLVGRALQGNLDLKIAIANVEKYVGLYGTTRSNLFPQISGFGEYYRHQSTGQLGSQGTLGGKEYNLARLGVQMNWELDIWGALRRANEASMADLLSQEAVQRAVILTLVSDVAQAYVQLRALDRDLEITKNVVETLKEDLRIRKIRFQEGYTSELEVSQAQSEYERRAALIPQYEQSIAQTEHALNVLLGKNPGPIERGLTLDELKLPTVPAGLPSDLLIRRPDIAQAEQVLVAANARIGVARGQYFPRIALTGDVGQLGTQMGTLFTPGANFWTIGSTMLTPIFTAGKIAGEVHAAEATQKAALANYRRAIISAFREFEDALVGQQKTKEQRDKQANRVAAVANYFDLSRIRYDEGYTDYITVLDSIRQLFDAQVDLVQAQNSNLIASIDLYRAMGGGWIVQAEQKAGLPKPKEASVFP